MSQQREHQGAAHQGSGRMRRLAQQLRELGGDARLVPPGSEAAVLGWPAGAAQATGSWTRDSWQPQI